jgi:hypothetical protein
VPTPFSPLTGGWLDTWVHQGAGAAGGDSRAAFAHLLERGGRPIRGPGGAHRTVVPHSLSRNAVPSAISSFPQMEGAFRGSE